VHWETPSWLGKLFWCQRRNVVFRVRDHGGEHGGVEKEAEGEDNLRSEVEEIVSKPDLQLLCFSSLLYETSSSIVWLEL
jgi:hypothetical protein